MNGLFQKLKSFFSQAFTGLKKLKTLNLSLARKVFSLMGKREKIAFFALLAIALAALFFSARNFYLAHTKPAPANGGSYTEGLLGQPVYINPLLAFSDTDSALVQLVFSGLYKRGKNGELVPDLAESMPEISADQKQYTIKLKKDVVWQNDKNFTADDVIFTIQALKDPSSKSPLKNSWQNTTVEKLGDFEIKFTTKDISSPFLSNLGLGILPKNVWSKIEAKNFLLSDINLKAIGSGPFSIKQIIKESSGKIQQIKMQANPRYFLGRPKLDEINIMFFDQEQDLINNLHSGEINGFGFIPLDQNLYLDEKRQGTQTQNSPLPQYQMVLFNLNNKILNELAVRQALNLATDRSQIITEVFKNNALLPSSPFLADYVPNSVPSQANLSEAAKLLDSAGWPVNASTTVRSKKNVNLELNFYTNDFLLNSQAAGLLAQQWKKLDIKVNLHILSIEQLKETAIRPRNFDILLLPQKYGSDPDPFAFWHSSQIRDPGLNLTGFADPEADKLITAARTTTNNAARREAYAQLDNLFKQKLPAIFLDQTQYIYALDKNIKNVKLSNLRSPSERFANVANWYIKTKRMWAR